MVDVRVPCHFASTRRARSVVQGDGEHGRRAARRPRPASYPGIRPGLFDAEGELRRFVNIYVNDEDMRYLGRLETPLEPGDMVSILPAVAGG